MQLIIGKLARIQTREAGNPGNTWTETTLVIQDFGVTHYATVARDFGPLPAEGEEVAVSVGVRAYVKKSDNSAGFGLTAFRRETQIESALNGLMASATV
jgi:hypothetical protein